MNGMYILRHNVVEEPDVRAWGRWMETAARHIGDTTINGFRVSTVFLGLDHQFRGGPPLIFETMVFPGGTCDRYSTWEEAEAGHRAMIERVKAGEFDLEDQIETLEAELKKLRATP